MSDQLLISITDHEKAQRYRQFECAESTGSNKLDFLWSSKVSFKLSCKQLQSSSFFEKYSFSVKKVMLLFRKKLFRVIIFQKRNSANRGGSSQ